MSTNSSIYPSDFPVSKGGGSDAGSDLSQSIAVAIEAVEINARDTALREAHSRRIAGQAIIAAQNKLTPFSGGLMPASKVGKMVAASPFLGTVGYTGGGTNHQGVSEGTIIQFLFSNRIPMRVGIALTNKRVYTGVVGDRESGKFVGGLEHSTPKTSVEKLTFFKNIVVSVAESLSAPYWGMAGGMGDANTGVLVGGAGGNHPLWAVTRDGRLYDHASDRLTTVSNMLDRPKQSAHQALSSKYAGYVWSGLSNDTPGLVSNPILRIDKIPYSAINTSAPLSNILSENQCYHTALSSEDRGYILGGSANDYRFLDTISGFTYSGETNYVVNAKLSQPLTCVSGTGSSKSGFIFGGMIRFTPMTISREIQEFDYVSQSRLPIDTKLDVDFADQGSVSDYSPGFSYA